MTAKTYTFESKNMGAVEFSVTGEYRDGSKDISVFVAGNDHDFIEIDGGSVDETFAWLIEQGVEFESSRSFYFNVHYVASVLVDGDGTADGIMHRMDCKDDKFFADWERDFREWM